jgi:hypothetical protein
VGPNPIFLSREANSRPVQGTSEQIVNGRLAAEISRFGVANLANSPAITCDMRLEPENFCSQFDSLRFIQRFLNERDKEI